MLHSASLLSKDSDVSVARVGSFNVHINLGNARDLISPKCRDLNILNIMIYRRPKKKRERERNGPRYDVKLAGKLRFFRLFFFTSDGFHTYRYATFFFSRPARGL